MPLDISGSWTLYKWNQTLTYSSRTGETSWASYTASALRMIDTNTPDYGSETVETPTHAATWHIWGASMNTPFVPKRGDKFSVTGPTGSQTWQVESVQYKDNGTRFTCECNQTGFGG